jgi:hypothetical protein
MKIAIDTNHNVIPKPEPPIAVVKHLKEGKSTLNSQDQIQQIMTKSLLNWIEEQPIRKHIHKTEAISRAPI